MRKGGREVWRVQGVRFRNGGEDVETGNSTDAGTMSRSNCTLNGVTH